MEKLQQVHVQGAPDTIPAKQNVGRGKRRSKNQVVSDSKDESHGNFGNTEESKELVQSKKPEMSKPKSANKKYNFKNTQKKPLQQQPMSMRHTIAGNFGGLFELDFERIFKEIIFAGIDDALARLEVSNPNNQGTRRDQFKIVYKASSIACLICQLCATDRTNYFSQSANVSYVTSRNFMIDKSAASFIRSLGNFDSGEGEYVLIHFKNTIESLIEYLYTFTEPGSKEFEFLFNPERKDQYLQTIANMTDIKPKINGYQFEHNAYLVRQLIIKNAPFTGELANFTQAYQSSTVENWDNANTSFVTTYKDEAKLKDVNDKLKASHQIRIRFNKDEAPPEDIKENQPLFKNRTFDAENNLFKLVIDQIQQFSFTLGEYAGEQSSIFEKFIPSKQGNAHQIVKVNGPRVEVPFPMRDEDIRYGILFQVCKNFEVRTCYTVSHHETRENLLHDEAIKSLKLN